MAQVPRPLAVGFGGGGLGGESNPLGSVYRPRLVLTVGKWKAIPPKHTHMCFMG